MSVAVCGIMDNKGYIIRCRKGQRPRMRKMTVKRRIFRSNAWMVLVTLIVFFLINLAVVKVYSESIERELRTGIGQTVNEDELEDLVKDWTVHRDEFFVLFLMDGILCIVALLLLSQVFTRCLTKRIMEPLYALEDGARRIRSNELTWDIVYTGDLEFENVCATFNDMQRHILSEQEKNHRYEKARTDMIAGISHDLRTPLTAIRGMIKGLLDGVVAAPEQQERFLKAAYKRTGDMDLLLNQLFYLSKLQTGSMPLSLKNVEIAAFLQKYVREKEEFMEAPKEQITLETNGITAEVLVDMQQLGRILDNLLENSEKYSGAASLNIKLTLQKEADDRVLIRFSDNGAGVPEDKLPLLFDEFYRVDESRNEKKGNGLGLYIVKYLIEAMGGSVHAENENGLVICMELPISEEKGV